LIQTYFFILIIDKLKYWWYKNIGLPHTPEETMPKIVDLNNEKKDDEKNAGDAKPSEPAKKRTLYNPLRNDDGAPRNKDVLSWGAARGMKGSH
jgi:hypothetical protein